MKTIFITFLLLLVFIKPSSATIYFYFDSEGEDIDAILPLVGGGETNFCQTECTGNGDKGTTQSSGGTPQGTKYFEWLTVDSQLDAYTEIVNDVTFPVTLTLGTTYYVAYYFNFSRIGGLDIWNECVCQSADKGIELVGNGIRWILSRGQWEDFSANQDHRYTIWGGNPPDLNPAVKFLPNLAGYSDSNMPQLQYETWYSAVMAVKIADDATGSYTVWLDGVKIIEYNNVITAADGSPTATRLVANGTIKQPDYDSPPHNRKFDALMLTDNLQDVLDGGYLDTGNVSSFNLVGDYN